MNETCTARNRNGDPCVIDHDAFPGTAHTSAWGITFSIEAPAETDPYADQKHMEWCPICGVDHEVVDYDEAPSMLGYGVDSATTLDCGHVVTYDPFTGELSAKPARKP